ncbi:hypothetical protein ANCDUO_20614, partial [Ancylostoma duodenale]
MAHIGIRPENELQTRSRIVTNQLKDRDNCIVLKIDTQMTTVNNISPFGFHFELDKKRYKERKKQIRRQILLLATFVFIGGAIFLKLESENEIT